MNGVTWQEGGIAFLLQGNSYQTALSVQLQYPGKLPKDADHKIDLKSELVVSPTRFPEHPLVDDMSPVPREGPTQISYVPTGLFAKSILTVLSRMSSPVRSSIRPFWSLKPVQILKELEKTNVQTLVLTDVTLDDRVKFDKVVSAASSFPRKLVLHGDAAMILSLSAVKTPVPPEWNLNDLIALPWEAYGAYLLRQHMLGK